MGRLSAGVRVSPNFTQTWEKKLNSSFPKLYTRKGPILLLLFSRRKLLLVAVESIVVVFVVCVVPSASAVRLYIVCFT